MPREGQVVNGIDVGALEEYIEAVREDPSQAERSPTLVARWNGAAQTAVDFQGRTVTMGGEEDPSAMWMLLASLAACDVEVVATHAALLGLELEDLTIEASGHFDIRRLLGLDGPGPGYDGIAYTVRVKAPRATEEQLDRLREMCERGSPVGDSLSRSIPVTFELETV